MRGSPADGASRNLFLQVTNISSRWGCDKEISAVSTPISMDNYSAKMKRQQTSTNRNFVSLHQQRKSIRQKVIRKVNKNER